VGINHELDFACSLEGNDIGYVGKHRKTEPQEGWVKIYPGIGERREATGTIATSPG